MGVLGWKIGVNNRDAIPGYFYLALPTLPAFNGDKYIGKMRFLKHTITLSLILCASVFYAQEEYYDQKEQHDMAFQNGAQIRSFILEYVGKLEDGIPVKIEGEKIFARDVLPEFYKRIDYAPAWKDYDALRDAFEALKDSYEDGLDPEDYHMKGMFDIVERIEELDEIKESDYKWIAKFDLLMTDAVMMYAFHLIEGKVDPYELDVNWNYGYAELPGGDGERLAKAIEAKSVSSELHKLRPDIPAYTMLKEELAHLRKIEEGGGWKSIPDGGKIDPGTTDPRIPKIKNRLKISGDLSNLADMDSQLYDDMLEEDIRFFQTRHGLTVDGIIGKGTFTAFNVPVKERIDQVRVNLERFRWVFHNIPENFILVNIARFRAWVIRGTDIVHKTNVQVGTYYHKTPVFRSKLRYIEFNPTWTVPRSITINEILPKLLNDHNNLKDRNRVLLDRDGNIVAIYSVNYESLSSSNFPYVIRQEPGP